MLEAVGEQFGGDQSKRACLVGSDFGVAETGFDRIDAGRRRLLQVFAQAFQKTPDLDEFQAARQVQLQMHRRNRLDLRLEPLASVVDQVDDGNQRFADRADDADDVVKLLLARRVEDFIGAERRDALL